MTTLEDRVITAASANRAAARATAGELGTLVDLTTITPPTTEDHVHRAAGATATRLTTMSGDALRSVITIQIHHAHEGLQLLTDLGVPDHDRATYAGGQTIADIRAALAADPLTLLVVAHCHVDHLRRAAALS